MKRVYFSMTAAAVLAAAYGAQAQHHDHGPAAPPAAAKSVLRTPEAMRLEHHHLHEQLAAALAAGGKTAEAAKAVEAALAPHFVEEETYAMPPLALLAPIARREKLTEEQIDTAIAMTDKLRANYGHMLKEHASLVKALDVLLVAAKAENKPQAAAFAEGLKLHARHEEEVLYPAALLVGDYLKAKRPAARD